MGRSHERCRILSSVPESQHKERASRTGQWIQEKETLQRQLNVSTKDGQANAILFTLSLAQLLPQSLTMIILNNPCKLCKLPNSWKISRWGWEGTDGNPVHVANLGNSSQKDLQCVLLAQRQAAMGTTLGVNAYCHTSRISTSLWLKNLLDRSAQLKMLNLTPEILILPGRGAAHNRHHVFETIHVILMGSNARNLTFLWEHK